MVLVLVRLMLNRSLVEGILRWAVLVFLMPGLTASAQEKSAHWLNAGNMPPGAIGSQRLNRGGPLSGYFQPVRIRAPEGARIALAVEGSFGQSQANEALASLLIGPVYRLQVTGIPNHPGLEIFPTVEIIDRLYPPRGLRLRYPIPIELTADELELAAGGAFVTRVIYIEDPSLALPVQQKTKDTQPWMEAARGEEPLIVADRLGRPMAILRIGGRVPTADGANCDCGCSPPLIMHDPSEVPPNNCPVPGAASNPGIQEGKAAGEPLSRNNLPGLGATFRAIRTCSTDDGPSFAPTELEGDASVIIEDGQPTEPMDAPLLESPSSEYLTGDTGPDGAPCEGSCDSDCCDEADPYACFNIVGPSDEYLCDGGDFGSPAGVLADWTIDGLDREDAIAHYDTLAGRVVVTQSNRVCIYAPRFAAVRRVVNLMAHEQPVFVKQFEDDQSLAKAAESQPVAMSLQRHAPIINLAKRPPSLYRQRQQPGELVRLQATMDTYLSLAPYANLQIIRTGVIDNAEKPRLAKSIESAITLTANQAAQVLFGVKAAHAMVGVKQPGVLYRLDEPESPKLRLIKLASCGHALPGDIVEFTLRFDNVGDQVIGNVTIVDSLTTRFEYIPDSAKSSVDANFITEPNDAESSILRWEIKAPVKPNEGGVLRFQVRVR